MKLGLFASRVLSASPLGSHLLFLLLLLFLVVVCSACFCPGVNEHSTIPVYVRYRVRVWRKCRAQSAGYASGSFEKYELRTSEFYAPTGILITTGRTVNPGYFIVVKVTSIGRYFVFT